MTGREGVSKYGYLEYVDLWERKYPIEESSIILKIERKPERLR
jgi:hypothetical protein